MWEIIKQPWPWWIAGPFIALIMFLLLYMGKNFGVSSTLQTTCAMAGAGKFNDFFKINWKAQIWNLLFVAGALIGGFVASKFMVAPDPIALSVSTIQDLKALGLQNPGEEYVPSQIFNWYNLFTLQGFIIMVVGGFLVGFGARYAGGCTSGHAISGLSNFQLPSLIAVIGFFIGGLISTFLLLPWLLY